MLTRLLVARHQLRIEVRRIVLVQHLPAWGLPRVSCPCARVHSAVLPCQLLSHRTGRWCWRAGAASRVGHFQTRRELEGSTSACLPMQLIRPRPPSIPPSLAKCACALIPTAGPGLLSRGHPSRQGGGRLHAPYALPSWRAVKKLQGKSRRRRSLLFKERAPPRSWLHK